MLSNLQRYADGYELDITKFRIRSDEFEFCQRDRCYPAHIDRTCKPQAHYKKMAKQTNRKLVQLKTIKTPLCYFGTAATNSTLLNSRSSLPSLL